MSRLHRLLIALAVSAALLPGCGQEPTGDGTTAAPTEVWDLTWFSDSGASGMQPLWIERIEETQGVEVRVHDYSGMGSDSSAFNVLGKLEGDPEVRKAVAGSEVILVSANPLGSGGPQDVEEYCYYGTQEKPPAAVSRGDYTRYARLLRSVYDAILELRDGRPTVIRAVDIYVPVVALWREEGKMPVCMRAWETGAAVSAGVAAEYGVPSLSLLDVLNGPRHNRDLAAAGLLEDAWHLNDRANRIGERALHELGYEPVAP